MVEDEASSPRAARRAMAFGTRAASYATHRPGYPEEAVRWALAPLAERDRRLARDGLERLDVLDLAAGTGKLTEVLVGLGVHVMAVEPDTAMLAELRVRLPDVSALQGRAEAIPLEDASVDAVLVGQAFHWFDREAALPEIARVLRPGGVLAALWNLEDVRVEWVAALARVSRLPRDLLTWRNTPRFTGDDATGGSSFSDVERGEFPYVDRLTHDTYLARMATRSRLLVMSEDERAEVLSQIRDEMTSRPETASGSFDLPMVTGVERVVRLP
ncbi:MAG TPA: class I SAM-dependent methyltransferase [Actinopolymorphaceae bacterium]